MSLRKRSEAKKLRAPDLFDRLVEVDERLAAHGYPVLSPFWRDTLRSFLRSTKRWLTGRIGRRGGKGVTSCKLAVTFALFATIANLPPGERAFVQFLSVDRDEAANRLRMICAMLDVLGEKYAKRGDEVDLESRPVTFRVTTASIRGVVGRTTILVIADEGARWRDAETGANPAREILASIAPSMATQPSARGCFLSAPWSENDHHAQRFEEGDSDRQMVCYAPSWVANPTLTEEQTRSDEPDPRTWSREYAAIPIAGVTSICSSDELKSVTNSATRRPRVDGGLHALTIDAGFKVDCFAASVWHIEFREGPDADIRQVLVQDAILHLVPSFLRSVKIDAAVAALAKLARDFDINEAHGDGHYSEALGPALAEMGILLRVLSMSSASITQRVQSFQARLAAASIDLLTHEPQRKEILEAHLIHHSGGRVTLRAPENARGKHDDLISTILLAHDAEVAKKLPPCDAGLIVEHDPIFFDHETHALHGGRAHYFRRIGTKLIEREPPYGSVDFIEHANAMADRGQYTPLTLRWFEEQGGPLPHLRKPETERDGVNLPIARDE